MKTDSPLSDRRKPRHGRKAAALAIVLVVAICFAPSATAKKAPDFTLTDTDGNTFNVSDFRGRVVVLDFMATWCTACKKIMDDLREVHAAHPDVVFISIDIDSTESNQMLETFKQRYNATWRFALDTDGVSQKYGVVTIPKTVVINPSGEIAFSHTGEISTSRLSSQVEKAREGKTAGIPFFGVGLPVIAMMAGILSFFSPCAFPLLPGYMAYYLGREKEEGDARTAVKRGFWKGLQPAAGILLFDALLGMVAILAGDLIKPYIPYFEPIVGGLLILLGIVMIANIPLFSKLASRFLSKTTNLAGKKQRYGLFFYGIIYAAAAAGCTAPVFIAIILLALSAGFLSGIVIFLLYALAMAAVMAVVTVLVALSKELLLQKLRISSRYIEKITGVLLILVGGYLLYYTLTAL